MVVTCTTLTLAEQAWADLNICIHQLLQSPSNPAFSRCTCILHSEICRPLRTRGGMQGAVSLNLKIYIEEGVDWQLEGEL